MVEPRELARALVWRGGDADAWQCHASLRGCSGGATWQCEGLASDVPTG